MRDGVGAARVRFGSMCDMNDARSCVKYVRSDSWIVKFSKKSFEVNNVFLITTGIIDR